MTSLVELENRLQDGARSKYSWLEDTDIERAYNYALADYLLYKYPTENNRPEKELLKITFEVEQWLAQRMEDILSRGGATNVKAYRENGISWEYASSHIDNSLAAMITPKASVPK